MAPLRILHVVTIMNRAGIETLLMTLFRNIDRTKIQFDFLVHRQERGDYDDEIEQLGGKIFRVPALQITKSKMYEKSLDTFFKEHQEYPIIHSHLNANSYLVLKVAKRNNIPVRIAHSHITSSEGIIVKKVFKSIQKYLLRSQATHFFACSLDAAKWLFGQKNSQNTIIFKNAIETKKFIFSKEIRGQYIDKFNFAGKTVYGHIGRFTGQKNHLFLLDVFKEIVVVDKESVLLLVGDGDLKDSIIAKIRDLELEDNVVLLGVRKDIPELLNMMDVFVFPSLFEGLGIVAIEAQCVGLTTFVSSELPEELYVTDNIYGISLSKSAKDWSDTILEKKQKQIDRQIQYKYIIDANYDVDKNVKFLEKFYYDVAPNDLCGDLN